MDRRYTYFEKDHDKEFYINSMKKYLENKQSLDIFLEKLIFPYIDSKSLKILDACCGIGHLTNFLSDMSPNSQFLGIDQTPFLIDEAKKICQDKKNVSFEVIDIYDLGSKFSKSFDITINWKTLSWLPYYDQCMKSLIDVTKKHIFLSSLFYDGDIDFEIKVREFQKEGGSDGFNRFYNVYSLPQFKKFIYNLNVKNIEVYDFKIDVDIPKPSPDHMGTYTVTLDDGNRLQLSGAILMCWKIIRIDL